MKGALLPLVVAGLLVAGCAASGSAGIRSSLAPPTSATSTLAAAQPSPIPPSGTAVGRSGVQQRVTGTIPGARACVYREAPSGEVFPDPHCTPGATDPRVTQANITVTVCAKGYTSRVRPPVEETDHAKRLLMLAYGSTGSAHGYELDHLIPLELGGSSDVWNLWPEPGASPNPKDAVEDQLRDMVCAQVWGIGGPALPLAVAQRLISADWTSAISQARK